MVTFALAAFLAATPSAGWAQNGERADSVGDDAIDAVTQPLSDLNLRTKDIPLLLQVAQTAPYELPAGSNCAWLTTEIERFEEVLGPDADAPDKGGGIFNKGLQLGGNILGGFIPFRGLVRQLSGANAERARWEEAVYAGVARRAYLKGYAKGLGCANDQKTALQSAESVLGLEPSGPD